MTAVIAESPAVDVTVTSEYMHRGYREVEALLEVHLAPGIVARFTADAEIHGLEGDTVTLGGTYLRTRRAWIVQQIDHRWRPVGSERVVNSLRAARDLVATCEYNVVADLQTRGTL